MKTYLLVALLVASQTQLLAQQDPLYSQYLFNPLLINPAYAGSTTDFNASVMYRKQWAGFEGSPVTMNANAHMALANNRMGAGLIILQDKLGVDKTTEVTATYGYHLPLTSELKLSFGLQASVINYFSDFSSLLINRADAKFTNQSEWKPNIGTGVVLCTETFMVGLSMPKLLKASNSIESVSTALYNQHFYGFASYVYQLSYRIKLKPWVLFRTVSGTPLSFDYIVSIKVDDSYTLGLLSRNLTTYGAFMQINLGDHLRFGYIFEVPSQKSVGIRYTTHELTIGLRLKLLNFHDLDAIRNF